MSDRSKAALFAVLGLVVAALVLVGCAASTPPADKMAEATLKAMQTMSGPPKGDDENVELSPEAVKAIEGVGVSEASFRAGLKRAKEDKEYEKEIGKALQAEMMKMIQKGGMPMMPHPPTGK